jgi:hypothetical protein
MTRVVTMEEVVGAIEREVRHLGNAGFMQERRVYREVVYLLERSNLGREAIEVKLTRPVDNENACSCRQAGSWEASRACGHVVGEPALLVIGEEGET